MTARAKLLGILGIFFYLNDPHYYYLQHMTTSPAKLRYKREDERKRRRGVR